MELSSEKPAFNQFFHDFISGKAKQLCESSSAISQLAHNPTKGLFREYSFINLMSEFLPIPFAAGKGIIADCTGNQSPETDMLIYNTNLLPPILIAESVGIFPFESVRYWFEIKSEFDRSAIIDCCDKIRRHVKLMRLENYERPWLNYPIPCIFAYRSSLTIEKLFEIFKEQFPNFYSHPPFQAICIMGLGYLSFCGDRGEPGKKWMFIPATEEKYEVISLIAGILNTLIGQRLPSFGYYLMHDETTGFGKFI